MNVKDIIIDNYYRHKEHTNYAYIKPLKILKPHQEENTNSYTVVKCEYVINKNDSFGLIKYFKPINIVNV